MPTMKETATEFLTHKRVAVTGVSRKPANHGSNVVYKRLRDRGYEVYAVNPNANEVEGDKCYTDLKSVPADLEWVVIGTKPETAEGTMHECVELGIPRVWMHRSFGEGSVSPTATTYGREHDLRVIDGGCPCMYGPTADPGHKVMRTMLQLTRKLPRKV
jgi:predicted CoA-binding protein